MGETVSERTAELSTSDQYQEYLFPHGLGVEMAEALAEFWHHRIRSEWGFVHEDGPTLHGLLRQHYRGGRYSWGYPVRPCAERLSNMIWMSRWRSTRESIHLKNANLSVPA